MTCEQVFSVDMNENGGGITGVSILVVDCDSTCLAIVSKMLHISGYKVITATRPADALRILLERQEKLDLILTEIHLPDIDKYELLETMRNICCLPIVILSADNNENVMLGCLFKGAMFYVVKPITMKEVKTLWQFSCMKNGKINLASEGSCGYQGHLSPDNLFKDASDCPSGLDFYDQNLQNGKRKEREAKDNNEQDTVRSTIQKKPKLIWTNELHHRFLEAVRTLGIDGAHPKKILEYMNVPGLKKEHISSHLQKYRLSLRRKQYEAQKTMFGDDLFSPWNMQRGPSDFMIAELLMNRTQPKFRSYFDHHSNGSNPSISMSTLSCINYPVNMQISPLSDQIDSTHASSSQAGIEMDNIEELRSFYHMRNENVQVFSNDRGSGFEIASDGIEIVGDSPQEQEQYILPPLSPLLLAWEQEEGNTVGTERVEADDFSDITTFFDDILND